MLMSVSLRQDMFAMDRLMEDGEVDAAINVASETKETAKRKAQSNMFDRLKSAKARIPSVPFRKKERRILAICDPDEQYLSRLSGYLTDHLSLPFEIREYTNAKRLCEDRQSAEPAILLISENLYPALLAHASQPFQDLILLEESDARRIEEVDLEENVPAWKHSRISKYTSTERIVTEILDHSISCSQVLRTGSGSAERFQIFGVYSPLTRCLQSTFAMTLAQTLKKRGKVLYMTFEPFASLPALQGLQAEYDLTDFLYFFECYPTKTPLYVEKVKQNISGIDVIPPARNYIEIKAIPGTKWEEMFKWIAQYTDYHYLVLDLHEFVCAHTSLLELSDRVFTMTREDDVSMSRILQYKELLIRNGLERVWEKTSRISLPLFDRLPARVEDYPQGPVGELVRDALSTIPWQVKRWEQRA